MTGKPLDPTKVFDRVSDRWPEAGDRPFANGRHVFPAQQGAERTYRMVNGYKLAGDLLIQQRLADRSDGANLVFPALFNYRHYLELVLKDMNEKFGGRAGEALADKNHKLPNLWASFERIAAAYHIDCTGPDMQSVKQCVEDFDAVDAGGTAFRYSQTLRGTTPQLPHEGLDLLHLHDVMNGVENFFECAAMEFGAQDDAWSDAYQNAPGAS